MTEQGSPMPETTIPTWLQGTPEPIRTDWLCNTPHGFGGRCAMTRSVLGESSARMARATRDGAVLRDDIIEDFECDCRSLSLHLRSGRTLIVFLDGRIVQWNLLDSRPKERSPFGPPLSEAYCFVLDSGTQYIWRPFDVIDAQLGERLAGVSACSDSFYFQCQGLKEVGVLAVAALDQQEPFLKWGYQ